jgi:hypothetical protein
MGVPDVHWEELAIRLAVGTVTLVAGVSSDQSGFPINAEARVTRTVRMIDRLPPSLPG